MGHIFSLLSSITKFCFIFFIANELDKELDAKIDESAKVIEKSKSQSAEQTKEQIHEITKLTISKVARFNVSDDEIKNAVTNSERSIN